jgi:hypothetical protein
VDPDVPLPSEVNDSITQFNIYLAEDPEGTNRQQLASVPLGTNSYFIPLETPKLDHTHILIHSANNVTEQRTPAVPKTRDAAGRTNGGDGEFTAHLISTVQRLFATEDLSKLGSGRDRLKRDDETRIQTPTRTNQGVLDLYLTNSYLEGLSPPIFGLVHSWIQDPGFRF